MTAERTYKALLIGNGAYSAPAGRPTNLWGPANDVAAIKAALCDEDWGLHTESSVEVLIDQGHTAILRALETFFKSAAPTDQLFVFYSGHGLLVDPGRLCLCAADTESDLPAATTVAVETVNQMIDRTRAAATAIVFDCCYSGMFKGPDPALAAQGRGRWLLAASRRDQLAADATSADGLSPFSELLARGLVCGPEMNLDAFVTMTDIARYITPRLEEHHDQTATFLFEGSGDLAVALAPGYPAEFDQTIDQVVRLGDKTVAAPTIPSVTEPDVVEVPVPPTANARYPGAPESDVAETVIVALRNADAYTIRLMLQAAVRTAAGALDDPEGHDEVLGALDLVTVVAATCLNLGAAEHFDDCVRALTRCYDLGFEQHGLSRQRVKGSTGSDVLWLAIYVRVLALGGLAQRGEAWTAVRDLTLQRPEGQDFNIWPNWLRHAHTMAARGNLFDIQKGGRKGTTSPILLARDFTLGHPTVMPDLHRQAHDVVLTGICRFDALACVIGYCASPGRGGSQYYPDFARFSTDRTEPAFERLVSDEGVRKVLTPVNDRLLADALVEVDAGARREAQMFDGWWGYQSMSVIDFVNRLIPPT